MPATAQKHCTRIYKTHFEQVRDEKSRWNSADENKRKFNEAD